MKIDPHTAMYTAEFGGRTFYFCSAGCANKFKSDPLKYVGDGAKKPAEPVLEGTIYTCPMHPEIRQIGPGSCPICGMALEPVLATAETGPSPELIDMTRRFWIGLALSIPVVALEMGGHLTGLHTLLGLGRRRTGCSSFWPRQWSCGLAGRFSCAAHSRW